MCKQFKTNKHCIVNRLSAIEIKGKQLKQGQIILENDQSLWSYSNYEYFTDPILNKVCHRQV